MSNLLLWHFGSTKGIMMKNEVSNNLPLHFYHTRNGYGDAIFVFDSSHSWWEIYKIMIQVQVLPIWIYYFNNWKEDEYYIGLYFYAVHLFNLEIRWAQLKCPGNMYGQDRALQMSLLVNELCSWMCWGASQVFDPLFFFIYIIKLSVRHHYSLTILKWGQFHLKGDRTLKPYGLWFSIIHLEQSINRFRTNPSLMHCFLNLVDCISRLFSNPDISEQDIPCLLPTNRLYSSSKTVANK